MGLPLCFEAKRSLRAYPCALKQSLLLECLGDLLLTVY
jgi:hypothetical protein